MSIFSKNYYFSKCLQFRTEIIVNKTCVQFACIFWRKRLNFKKIHLRCLKHTAWVGWVTKSCLYTYRWVHKKVPICTDLQSVNQVEIREKCMQNTVFWKWFIHLYPGGTPIKSSIPWWSNQGGFWKLKCAYMGGSSFDTAYISGSVLSKMGV